MRVVLRAACEAAASFKSSFYLMADKSEFITMKYFLLCEVTVLTAALQTWYDPNEGQMKSSLLRVSEP